MREIDDGPGHARRAAKYGEDENPGEEQNENIGGPNTGIQEPFCVPIQIRRRHSLHIEISHRPRF